MPPATAPDCWEDDETGMIESPHGLSDTPTPPFDDTPPIPPISTDVVVLAAISIFVDDPHGLLLGSDGFVSWFVCVCVFEFGIAASIAVVVGSLETPIIFISLELALGSSSPRRTATASLSSLVAEEFVSASVSDVAGVSKSSKTFTPLPDPDTRVVPALASGRLMSIFLALFGSASSSSSIMSSGTALLLPLVLILLLLLLLPLPLPLPLTLPPLLSPWSSNSRFADNLVILSKSKTSSSSIGRAPKELKSEAAPVTPPTGSSHSSSGLSTSPFRLLLSSGGGRAIPRDHLPLLGAVRLLR
mmetsp:Transcript_8106/g.16027  ORF Transcript_8106/g.16027 Transcript_8106/m.16027 type:complete len:302 (-) Transcript_8106:434-1339(-)